MRLVPLVVAVLLAVAGAHSAGALTAVDDAYQARSGLLVQIEAPGVLDNDHDGGGPLPAGAIAVLESPTSHGTLALNPNGSFDYTSAAGFLGIDSFTYHVADGATTSNTATVTLTVAGCAGGTTGTQQVCWVEAAYLQELVLRGYGVTREGFEDDVAWGAARQPATQPSVTSQGITWASNYALNGITTSPGTARTGAWAGNSFPHGDFSGATGSFIYDGFTGAGPGGDSLYAVGGWLVNNLGGGRVNFRLTRADTTSTVLNFPDNHLFGTPHFFGVIDTAGFATFEVFEIEGTVGQAQYVFGDDFTMATSVATDTTPPQVVLVNSVADTGDGVLSEGEATSAAITALMVSFSEQVRDPGGDSDPDDVTNPANYLLIGDGGNGFQTVDCAGGVAAGDVQVAVGAVTYTSGSALKAAFQVNGGAALAVGSYRLLVCGTTSITDWWGNPLDGDGNGVGGDDFARSFSITEPPVNRPPTANPQSATTAEDTDKAITLTASDLDGDPLTFYIAIPPAHGTLIGTAPNVTYHPTANYHGGDSFSFMAFDGQAFSVPAAVTITVTPVNDPPTANDQSVTTLEDTAKAIVLIAIDVDGDPLTYTVGTPPAHGTLSGTAPDLTYHPAANYHGLDEFTFTVFDGAVASNIGTVFITVTAVNDAPVADPQSVSTPRDTALAITLTGSDVDGDPLTFAIETLPAHGGLTGAPPDVTFTPTTGYSGPDSFTFTVNDGTATSAPATVSISVTGSSLSVLTIENTSLIEGDVGSTMVNATLTLTPASGSAVSVAYTTGGGTATAGSDYTAAAGTADFPAGATTAIVPLEIFGDLTDEPDETFDVTLSNPVGAVLGTPSSGTVTIFDDDPMPDLSGINLVVFEWAGQALVELSLSAASGFDITVDYATVDGTATAPADYGAVAGTAVIAAGATSTTVPIPIVSDATVEPDENFTLGLSAPMNAVLLTPFATVTIRDDGNPIFRDGFESGDVSAWSVAAP